MTYEKPNIENILSVMPTYSNAGELTAVHVPLLLWVNLMKTQGPSVLSCQLEKFFEIRVPQGGKTSKTKEISVKPDFICFEYDYPDCDSLNLLKETHVQHPKIPVIMFTLQHSEELAVWALRNRVWDYYYKPLSENCINELVREILNCFSNASPKNQSDDRQFINSSYPNEVRFKNTDDKQIIIDTALNYLSINYSQKICAQEVAELCNLSRFQFARLFKKVVGSTFQNYLLEYRINKAKKLLQIPNAKILDVAFSVGFTDPVYFTRVFKRIVGTSPSKFRAPH